MNNDRRKTLKEAYDLIDRGRDLIEQMATEERDVFDNMPENFQNGERGQRMAEIADNLDEAVEAIQGALDQIDDATA